jgi:hypothetical protein
MKTRSIHRLAAILDHLERRRVTCRNAPIAEAHSRYRTIERMRTRVLAEMRGAA